jgi:hypothetical protein
MRTPVRLNILLLALIALSPIAVGHADNLAHVYLPIVRARNTTALHITKYHIVRSLSTAALHVWGEIINTASEALYAPSVFGTLANARGTVTSSAGEVSLGYLAPGVTASFHVPFSWSEPDMQLTLQTDYLFADEEAVANPLGVKSQYLTVVSQQRRTTPTEEIFGEVQNDTTSTLVYCQVRVTLYDQGGNVVYLAGAGIATDPSQLRPAEGPYCLIPPGMRAPYRVGIPAPIDYISYRVQSEGVIWP